MRSLSLWCVFGIVLFGVIVPAGADNVQILKLDAGAFPTITCLVSVTDASGVPVTGLGARDLRVTENQVEVDGLTCTAARPDKQKVAFALAIDTSGSMRGLPLDQARQAVADFVSRLGPDDSCTLIGFSSKVTPIATFTGQDKSALEPLMRLRARGDTALYDAAARAVEIVKSQSADRRIAILLTDGQDTASTGTQAAVTTTAAAAGIPLHLIALGQEPSIQALRKMASATGGACYVTGSPAQLITLYQKILQRVRTYYVVSYETARDAETEQWRQVEIALTAGSKFTAATYVAPAGGVGKDDFAAALGEWAVPAVVMLCGLLDLGLLVALMRRRRS